MAADFIVIDRGKQAGNQLVRLAQMLVEVRDLSRALVATANHEINGGDYSLFEAQFGITAGAGANAVTLIGLIDNILNTTTDVTGANRKAQLDEFTARLAVQ